MGDKGGEGNKSPQRGSDPRPLRAVGCSAAWPGSGLRPLRRHGDGPGA